eukprot:10697919-Alexandrium_andersonii.AAC.1
MWSASSPAALPTQVEEPQTAVDELCIHRLGEDVCGVLLAGPLAQLKVPRPDTLLDPELSYGQIAALLSAHTCREALKP